MDENRKRILRDVGFKNEIDAVEAGFCPFCLNPISMDDFEDDRSKKEYEISGLCQDCQNKMFQE